MVETVESTLILRRWQRRQAIRIRRVRRVRLGRFGVFRTLVEGLPVNESGEGLMDHLFDDANQIGTDTQVGRR